MLAILIFSAIARTQGEEERKSFYSKLWLLWALGKSSLYSATFLKVCFMEEKGLVLKNEQFRVKQCTTALFTAGLLRVFNHMNVLYRLLREECSLQSFSDLLAMDTILHWEILKLGLLSTHSEK